MREGWTNTTIGEVCQVGPSKREARSKLDEADLVSVVPMSHLGILSKDIALADEQPLRDVVGSYTYFAEGDVLLAKITPCFENGKLGIARNLTNRIGFGSSEFIVLRPKPGIDAEFLFYFLSQNSFRSGGSRNMKGAAGQKRIPKPFVRHYPIPVPPVAEQKRIVAILDEAFAGIDAAKANAEKNLVNARELFASYLDSVFAQRSDEWPRTTLAQLCHSDRVITYGVIKLGKEVSDGVPCLRTSNVRWLRFETEGVKRIASSLSSEYARTVLRGGEVLVNVRGTLGGVTVAPSEMAGWNVSREVAVVPVDSAAAVPKYLAYWIGTRSSQAWLGGVKKGVAYVGINIEDLRRLPVPVPAEAEQAIIVSRADQMHAHTQQLEAHYRQRIASLSELKQSILQKAFSGELTAKGADKEMAAA